MPQPHLLNDDATIDITGISRAVVSRLESRPLGQELQRFAEPRKLRTKGFDNRS